MPETTVKQQNLPCRAVALLLRDRHGRVLLTQKGDGWDVTVFDLLVAGHSHEETARHMLRQGWGLDGPLRLLGLIPPVPEGPNSFTWLYEARIATPLAKEVARDTERHLLADHDELQGLEAHFATLFTPLLLRLVRDGLPQST